VRPFSLGRNSEFHERAPGDNPARQAGAGDFVAGPRRWGAVAANLRSKAQSDLQAHNLKVVGSNPTPATTFTEQANSS